MFPLYETDEAKFGLVAKIALCKDLTTACDEAFGSGSHAVAFRVGQLFQEVALWVDGEVDVVGFVLQFDAVVGIGGRFDESDFVNPVVGVGGLSEGGCDGGR